MTHSSRIFLILVSIVIFQFRSIQLASAEHPLVGQPVVKLLGDLNNYQISIRSDPEYNEAFPTVRRNLSEEEVKFALSHSKFTDMKRIGKFSGQAIYTTFVSLRSQQDPTVSKELRLHQTEIGNHGEYQEGNYNWVFEFALPEAEDELKKKTGTR